MNIIQHRQEERRAKISEIASNINKVLDAGMKVNKDNLILSMMSKYGLSEKITLEYLRIAVFEIGKSEDKIFEGLKQVKL